MTTKNLNDNSRLATNERQEWRYRTIKGEANAKLEEKRSQFLARLAHVGNTTAARTFIAEQKKKYYDARHNPYAYVLGERGNEQKSSDDGEPAGTAGSPILEAILRRGLTDVVAVVTRYFGGIKLGAGGLTRAYGQCVLTALDTAEILTGITCTPLEVALDYSRLAIIERWASDKNIRIENKIYNENVALTLLLPLTECESLEGEIINLTAGNCRLQKMAPRLVLSS